MKQFTVRLPEDLFAFWERKKKDIRRQDQLSEVDISNSMIFQGLVSYWRAMEVEKKDESERST